MTEMQRQFEEWCGGKPLKTDKNEVGLYKYVSTDFAWQAWQAAIASRAEIVVKLPDSFWGNLSELDSAQLRLLSSREGIRYE